MGRPKKSDRNSAGESREMILNISERIFAEKGFNAATTREISKAAGINKNLIFYYFNTKESLYRNIIERNIAPVYEKISTALSKGTSLDDVIEAIVDSYFSQFIKKPDVLPRILSRELADGGKYIAEFFSKHFEEMLPLWEKFIDSGEVSLHKHLLTIVNIIGSVVFIFLTQPVYSSLLKMQGASPLPNLEIKKHIINFIKNGVSA